MLSRLVAPCFLFATLLLTAGPDRPCSKLLFLFFCDHWKRRRRGYFPAGGLRRNLRGALDFVFVLLIFPKTAKLWT